MRGANDALVSGAVIFGYASEIVFVHVAVQDYTVLSFQPCYGVKLEQTFKYGLIHIRFSVSCD